jgi:nicotinamide riboside kinase
MLKVIVTGAFSTGKTGLVHSLAGDLIHSGLAVAYLPDVARNCPLPLNTDQTEVGTLWLLTIQIAREIEAAQGAEAVMLCDRGVPDILAHELELTRSARGRSVELLGPFLKHWMSTYDLILFSRVNEAIPIAPDGLRLEDSAYRTRLDQCAERVLAGRSSVEELPSGWAERVAHARDAIVRSLSRSAPAENVART